jgi:hypothetical protein
LWNETLAAFPNWSLHAPCREDQHRNSKIDTFPNCSSSSPGDCQDSAGEHRKLRDSFEEMDIWWKWVILQGLEICYRPLQKTAPCGLGFREHGQGRMRVEARMLVGHQKANFVFSFHSYLSC